MEQSRARLSGDLNEVVAFATVVQTGSFTRAARELGLPKSSVSRKVSELEARLGSRLLQRTTRSLSLTDPGRAFYEHAQRIVTELEEATATVLELEQAPRGLLRVTTPLNFGTFASIASAFVARYREVELDIVCSDRLVDLVEEKFDVAIRASKLADSSLVARPLGILRSFLVASPTYLAARGAPRQPADLKRHDCVIFGAGTDRGQWRLAKKHSELTLKVHGRLVANDFDIMRAAAVDGLGVALMPATRLGDDIEAGRLVRVLPDWCSPILPIHAVYPSTRHLSPKVRAFLDHVAASRTNLPWEPLPAATP